MDHIYRHQVSNYCFHHSGADQKLTSSLLSVSYTADSVSENTRIKVFASEIKSQKLKRIVNINQLTLRYCHAISLDAHVKLFRYLLPSLMAVTILHNFVTDLPNVSRRNRNITEINKHICVHTFPVNCNAFSWISVDCIVKLRLCKRWVCNDCLGPLSKCDG